MQFEEQISSSSKPYYIDTITCETQSGSDNFSTQKFHFQKDIFVYF